MADQFEDVIAEIHAEMRGVRDELAKLRTFDHFDTHRDPAKSRWLNQDASSSVDVPRDASDFLKSIGT